MRSAQANPLTRNVLIRYDPAATDEEAILIGLRTLEPDQVGEHDDQPAPPPVLLERHGETRRARIAVRGLDYDPDVARRVVEHFEQRPGVRHVTTSQLTGRVLVEYTEHEVAVPDLVADVAELELPALIGETRSAHPLDLGLATQWVTQVAGAAIGLGILAVERLITGPSKSTGTTGPAMVAGALSIADSFPAIRNSLRDVLGPDVTELLFGATRIINLTLARSPLGLALTGLEALRLFTEARARRASWREYEERLERSVPARPGGQVHLAAGERVPLTATILEGTGTSIGYDGLPMAAAPGLTVPASAPLHGGPFLLEFQSDGPFTPDARSADVAASVYDRYVHVSGALSLTYAALTALTTRSFAHTFSSLLLVNRRPALTGAQFAGSSASARVLRTGVTVVGTRADRSVRLPDLLLLDSPRLLTQGFEISAVLPFTESYDASELLAYATGISAASGMPWGNVFQRSGALPASDGAFDGVIATASMEDIHYSLGYAEDAGVESAISRFHRGGDYPLILRSQYVEEPLGIIALRPQLAPDVAELVHACQRHGVEVGVLASGDSIASAAISGRARVPLLIRDNVVQQIRVRQEQGARVAFVSDSARAGEAFAICDLAVGITIGNSQFPARADVLASDLSAVASIIEAGARRKTSERDSIALSVLANGIGAVWGVRARPGIESASTVVQVAALGAMADGWARSRGGERRQNLTTRIQDPQPERWGERSIEDILRSLHTTETGLTSAQAIERRRTITPVAPRSRIVSAILAQLRSPLTGILAAGAGLSLILGAPADVAMISAMIVANAAAGAWQESRADRAAEALEQMGTVTSHVLRDGQSTSLSAGDLVPGDVIQLVPGDRMSVDARLLSSQGLEVDEAALTGESFPVAKPSDGSTPASRIVLEGSDVTAGVGTAVVVAVGPDTRLGATVAALRTDDTQQSPLSTRLSLMLRQFLPIAAAGGAVVTISGMLRGTPMLQQVAIGASIAIAAVPEGLPLLAKIGEAAVARRLAVHQALVHRLSAVEALGRVDVVCTDKTGTLTEGRLRLRLVADIDQESNPSPTLPAHLRHVLLTAALAGPHPDALDAGADRTDMAVSDGAEQAGLGDDVRAERSGQLPFDSTRSFHASVAQNHLCVEGAVEVLAPRCDRIIRDGREVALDERGRSELLGRAQRLSERGLRVLMVAQGQFDAPANDPQELVALGFVGISDPLRPEVPLAVRRCHEAGVKVIMLTGDHPATARAIAHEAGLPSGVQQILTGAEIAAFDNTELDRRLAEATIIARATPLDKVRIVEGLQRLGHTVAMTGDGINDAPALRLADVGVAMGRGGTEVARQAADVVLADDNFATLVETFVEGRSFWRNIRRALGLLLGGNLGELGLQVGASILGLASPLSSRQILTVNLITDVLPALAVALQQPAHHNLAGLAREGASALDAPLRKDIFGRATATGMPTLVAYLLALRSSGLPIARTVAFVSIVTTQLAQTLDVGWSEGGLSRSILGAVASATGLLVATLMLSPLRTFLGLAMPTPVGLGLVAGATIAAVFIGRLRSVSAFIDSARPRILPVPSVIGAQ
ncbi:MAG: HAD-IC family P-type ATPase [Chloroflexota bacterium]|nr:HAD-IC family P-type ATPase [Chloroflexota bacterium]